MKKLIMILLLLGVLPFTTMAQDDDMYFVPTKENKLKEAKSYGMPSKTYYSGSTRTVDDYNRRSRISAITPDSVGNDIIEFSAVRGVYPDSTYTEAVGDDYQLTRRMSRFDDYTPNEAYWDGYRDGRWSSPWYYSSYYSWYDPWYWNDPWYYGRYYGWYSPWYYGYGYYRPWYYGYYGTRWYGGRSRSYYASHPVRRTTTSNRRFGESPSSGRTGNNGNRTFGTTRNNSSFGRGGSSFGGGRSSGGSGGGRSASGGRSFGGRR